jgi:hypothetical protein
MVHDALYGYSLIITDFASRCLVDATSQMPTLALSAASALAIAFLMPHAPSATNTLRVIFAFRYCRLRITIVFSPFALYVGLLSPAMTAMYCLPRTAYVIRPPSAAPARKLIRRSRAPVRASFQRALHRDEAARLITNPSTGPLFGDELADDDHASGTIYVLRSKSRQSGSRDKPRCPTQDRRHGRKGRNPSRQCEP